MMSSTFIHQLLDRRTEETPDATAIVSGKLRVTFGELRAQSNHVAAALAATGITSRQRIAICCDYSPTMVAALLGIVRAGHAYVAVDPSWPAQRAEVVLRSAGVDVAIIHARHRRLVASVHTVICLEDVAWQGPHDAHVTVSAHDDDPFCIVYTSGTTGTPVGVVVPHRSATHRARTMWGRYTPDPSHVSLLYRSCGMIGFSSDCFASLLNGAPVAMVEPAAVGDPLRIIRAALEYGVSHLPASPPLLEVLLAQPHVRQDTWRRLRVVRSTGAVLHADMVRRWYERFPEVPLVNVYGASECGGTTHFDTSADERALRDPVPAGYPAPGVRVVVLDADSKPAAPDEEGEIYVDGPHVASGYVDAAAAGMHRFLSDTTAGGTTARVRTGDIGRCSADGCLTVIGRADNQVKIRGFRVALEEVERGLSACDDVVAAAVKPDAGPDGAVMLVAYLVIGPGAPDPARRVRSTLFDRLPSYMVPSRFVVVGDLPRTSTGKIDRRALSSCSGDVIQFRNDFVPPATGEEREVAVIWCEILGVSDIGVDDDFFELGGHSLFAARIALRTSEAFGCDVGLRDVFEQPTVRQFATRISALAPARAGRSSHHV